MGKVRSFFSVLSCPKTRRGKATGVKNDKRLIKQPSTSESEVCGVATINAFSFSDRTNDVVIPRKDKVSPSVEFEIIVPVEDNLYSQKDIAVMALFNTLNLKMRQNLFAAFMCWHKWTMRVRLCRYFVKRIGLITAKSVDNSMRDAIVTLRQYRKSGKAGGIPSATLKKVDDNIHKGDHSYTSGRVLTISGERKVEKPRASSASLQESKTKGDSRVELGAPRQSSHSLAIHSASPGQGDTAKSVRPRSQTTGVSYVTFRGNNNNGLIHSSKVDISLKGVASTGNGNLKLSNKDCLLHPLLPSESSTSERGCRASTNKTYIDNTVLTEEKRRLSNVIYHKAIKNTNVMKPVVVTSKSNVVCQLEFFTLDKYVQYANKAINYKVLRDVNFTNSAIERLKVMAHKHGNKSFVISVTGGGCSGFQYHFRLVDDPGDLKCILNTEGCVSVFSDEASFELIDSCTIDYQSNLVGSKFVLDNIKNVSKRCSCGNSFDIKD